MDHRVKRAFVESHVDRVGAYIFHVAHIRPAPFDSLLLRMARPHKLQGGVREVEAELVGVAAGGQVGGNSLGGSAHRGGRSQVACEELYAISCAQVDDFGLFLWRFCREQVLFEEGLQRPVAAEPLVRGICSV